MRLRFNFIKFLFILFFIFLLIVAVYQMYCYFYVSASTEYTTVIECEDTVAVSFGDTNIMLDEIQSISI